MNEYQEVVDLFNKEEKELYLNAYQQKLAENKDSIYAQIFAECIAQDMPNNYAEINALYASLFSKELHIETLNDDKDRVLIEILIKLCAYEFDEYTSNIECDNDLYTSVLSLWTYAKDNVLLTSFEEKIEFVEQMNEMIGNLNLDSEDKERYQLHIDESVSIVIGKKLQMRHPEISISVDNFTSNLFNIFLNEMEPYSKYYSDEAKRCISFKIAQDRVIKSET